MKEITKVHTRTHTDTRPFAHMGVLKKKKEERKEERKERYEGNSKCRSIDLALADARVVETKASHCREWKV